MTSHAAVPPLQACAQRLVHSRQNAASSAGSETAITDSDVQNSSTGLSDFDGTASEVSSSGRGQGAGPVCRQKQRTGWGLQQIASSPVATAPGPATPAAVHSASPTAQGPILHQPYSHFVWCSSQQFSESRPLGFASALCTDIEEMQSVQGTCPVHVYLITH